jgi:hypothetical protein
MSDETPPRAGLPDYLTCDHKETEIRRRVLSDRRKSYARQCLRCGSQVGGAIPVARALWEGRPPPWDEMKARNWSAAQSAHWQRLRDEHNERWWAFYEEHLASDYWRDIRRRVMERCAGMCEGCGKRPAIHVHHLTYARLGHEMLFDLAAVCVPCHESIHGRTFGPEGPGPAGAPPAAGGDDEED